MRLPATVDAYSVIERVVTHLDLAGRAPFRDFVVLAVQHVHSSMVPLVAGLFAGGADPSRMTVVGKSYSTRPPAVAALRELGIAVVDPGRMRNPLRSYEEELDAEVEQVLVALSRSLRDGRPLLVLDEGAVAAKVLRRRPELVGPAFVVEQTTRGARWIDSAQMPFPVVDVARSAGKASLEGPLVAESMVNGLRDVLPVLGIRPRHVGVIGYGRMGAGLASRLSAGFTVSVHDLDRTNAAAAMAAGHSLLGLDAMLDAVDLLLGCTGTPVVDETVLARAGRPLLLVNGASSDIEYPLWSHRRAAALLPGSQGDPARPWRNHYAVASRSRHVLVAGGFPINFHAPGEPISPFHFQVTRALMLAGAAQAVSATATGPIPLETSTQEVIAQAYESIPAGMEASAP
jgi:S-adenosylhomocysteine hydrolase